MIDGWHAGWAKGCGADGVRVLPPSGAAEPKFTIPSKAKAAGSVAEGLGLLDAGDVETIQKSELGDEEDREDGSDSDDLDPTDTKNHADLRRLNVGHAGRLRALRNCAAASPLSGMASRVDYGATLRSVQARAEALGLGYNGARPRALFDCLRSSLPALA